MKMIDSKKLQRIAIMPELTEIESVCAIESKCSGKGSSAATCEMTKTHLDDIAAESDHNSSSRTMMPKLRSSRSIGFINRVKDEQREPHEDQDENEYNDGSDGTNLDNMDSKRHSKSSIGKPAEKYYQPSPISDKAKRKALEPMKFLFKKKNDKCDNKLLVVGRKSPTLETVTCSQDDERVSMSVLFQTPQKKLMVIPEQSRAFKHLSFPSPFKISKKKIEQEGEVRVQSAHANDDKDHGHNIILRTSELDPSVHQTKIPSAGELLIHARVCALLEGYDELLERRAKAGKRWFSFGDLVGLNRIELQNMYLNAIGKQPEIPLFIGDISDQPPPLPQNLNSTRIYSLGNPFDVHLIEIGSISSFTISSESTDSLKNKGRKLCGPKANIKPHPSTIKSLLECADDMIVEGYFTETIGYDGDLIDGCENTNVQVAVFSSQRQRDFIVCFRGSKRQYSKPIKNKGVTETDSNGGE